MIFEILLFSLYSISRYVGLNKGGSKIYWYLGLVFQIRGCDFFSHIGATGLRLFFWADYGVYTFFQTSMLRGLDFFLGKLRGLHFFSDLRATGLTLYFWVKSTGFTLFFD